MSGSAQWGDQATFLGVSRSRFSVDSSSASVAFAVARPNSRACAWVIPVNPESTEFLLFDATMTHISLTGCALPETLIFALWFILRHDDIVASDAPLKDLVGKLDVPSAVADRATARAAIETARTQYGEHIPLPGFGTAAPPKA